MLLLLRCVSLGNALALAKYTREEGEKQQEGERKNKYEFTVRVYKYISP